MRLRHIAEGALAAAVVAADVGLTIRTSNAAAGEPAPDSGPAILRLQARVDELQRKTPNQAIVMTHVAYHFTNLWFAARRRDWPLAGFLAKCLTI